MWAKRVTWRCPKPSEAPVDWLERTIQQEARDEQALFWQRRRHEAAVKLNQWISEVRID